MVATIAVYVFIVFIEKKTQELNKNNISNLE